MRKALILAGYIGLTLTALPAFLVFAGRLSFDQYKALMIGGAVLWFSTAPFFIDKKTKSPR
ncbi:hypothetical protein [Flaviaesturariibacter amylovorans]|uniref:Uncharacterized protein n=1 Tax=Flaviaesturariibacter amylovorans TaxID=1084520 RepID=A0ABP8H6N7_9BACT